MGALKLICGKFKDSENFSGEPKLIPENQELTQENPRNSRILLEILNQLLEIRIQLKKIGEVVRDLKLIFEKFKDSKNFFGKPKLIPENQELTQENQEIHEFFQKI